MIDKVDPNPVTQTVWQLGGRMQVTIILTGWYHKRIHPQTVTRWMEMGVIPAEYRKSFESILAHPQYGRLVRDHKALLSCIKERARFDPNEKFPDTAFCNSVIEKWGGIKPALKQINAVFKEDKMAQIKFMQMYGWMQKGEPPLGLMKNLVYDALLIHDRHGFPLGTDDYGDIVK